MSDWWSWALTLIGVSGFWLAGRKVWWAWYINIGNQIIWTAYALTTHQWGFLVGIPIYLAVFVPNAIRWTREHRTEKAAQDSFWESVTVRPGVMPWPKRRPLTERVWFWKPQWHWFGRKTLIPVFRGNDEWDWHTVGLGWTITGRVIFATRRCPQTGRCADALVGPDWPYDPWAEETP